MTLTDTPYTKNVIDSIPRPVHSGFAIPYRNRLTATHPSGGPVLAIDAHLDLAMNAVLWDRDLKLRAHETREIERAEGMTAKGRCAGTVGIPDLRAGEFGLVFSTVLARTNQGLNSGIDFRTQDNSYARAQGQLALYREFERQGIMRMIRTAADLKQ